MKFTVKNARLTIYEMRRWIARQVRRSARWLDARISP